jgi:dTMP kinase
LGLSRDWFDSFVKYQALIAAQFKKLQANYGFTMVDGNRSPDAINADLRRKIEQLLLGK